MSGPEDISLGQFKEQVLSDYRKAYAGRETLRVAQIESDCHYVTDRSDVGQVALARFVKDGDAYISAGLDLTAEMSSGRQTCRGFFSGLFSAAADVYSHGSASQMAVAVGMALAEASTRQAGQEAGERRIIVSTACGDFGTDGDFLESVCYAAARSLPLCIVLWNNNGTTSNGNMIRQLGGFGQTVRGRKTLCIEAVKGGDYAALCRVMATQTDRTRTGLTTLTFVSGAEDEIGQFGRWLEERQIATSQQLRAVEAGVRQEIERERRGAYLTSLVADTPIRHPHRQLMEIGALYGHSPMAVMPMDSAPGIVNKAIGVSRAGLLPVVSATAAEIRASLMASYPSVAMVVRTTDIESGVIMASTPASTEIWAPACHAEAAAAYADILSRPRQAVVIEPGSESAETKTGAPKIGGACRLAEGEDVTLLSFGSTTQPAADATALMTGQNTRIEHIHLCTLRPIDTDGIIGSSLRKTKRLAIVDSDPMGLTGSLIVAQLTERQDPMRHLMSAPVIVKPKSAIRPAEPHDICIAISGMLC